MPIAPGVVLTLPKQTLRIGEMHYSLKDSISIARGSIAAIVGNNGTGKSSLLNAIYDTQYKGKLKIAPHVALDVDVSGSVTAMPQDVKDLLPAWLRYRDVESLFFERLSGDGWSNRQREALTNLLIADLSGGQRQKLALDFLLRLSPDLMILDEPLSALDHNSSLLALDILKSHVMRTSTAALITLHDLFLLKESGASIIHLNEFDSTLARISFQTYQKRIACYAK